MAKFLNTQEVSSELSKLIRETKDRLVLVSPYLQINQQIRELVGNLNVQKRDIRIIYREINSSEDRNWLATQNGIRISVCQHLHAKCYLNERAAIVTSMNLYTFSQEKNYEMGIYISQSDDTELYDAVYDEVLQLLQLSEEKPIQSIVVSSDTVINASRPGFCIRKGTKIPFDAKYPFSPEGFNEWLKDKDWRHPENYCHFSGEKSNGKTCRAMPILHIKWNEAQKVYGKEKCTVKKE
jgi:phosphatidylserine/phosphatidylglycerophosphate/cardiolipin synthase-like enzyme